MKDNKTNIKEERKNKEKEMEQKFNENLRKTMEILNREKEEKEEK